MAWIRCSLSFSLLRSSIQCIRGARSTIGHAVKQPIPPLANFELHMCFQTVTHFIYFWISLLSTSYSAIHSLSPILVFCFTEKKQQQKKQGLAHRPPRSPPPTPLMCTITVAAFLAYTGNSYHALHRLAFNTFSCTLFRCDIG